VKRIRKWIEEVRAQKHVKFDDLNRIALRCQKQFPEMFPKYKLNKDGSAFVHHFNVNGIPPISLEKEHGSREFVPPRYAKLALANLEELANYIEHMMPDAALGQGTQVVSKTETEQNEDD
jgi:hypothetical protein